MYQIFYDVPFVIFALYRIFFTTFYNRILFVDKIKN